MADDKQRVVFPVSSPGAKMWLVSHILCFMARTDTYCTLHGKVRRELAYLKRDLYDSRFIRHVLCPLSVACTVLLTVKVATPLLGALSGQTALGALAR